jgi:glycosyltransferase involved in cell wall biosynthesis
VARLSLCGDEFVDETPPRQDPGTEHVLVVGNDYDHKDVDATVKRIIEAFPFTPISVLGSSVAHSPQVTSFESGQLPEQRVSELFAGARLIVYPSYYEGFGLPVVQGLAIGRTVIVRRSPLWEEIAANTRLPGTLVQFDTEMDLVVAIGSALHGQPQTSLTQGTALAPGQHPEGWAESAQRIVESLDQLMATGGAEQWLARDAALAGHL